MTDEFEVVDVTQGGIDFETYGRQFLGEGPETDAVHVVDPEWATEAEIETRRDREWGTPDELEES